MIESSKELPHPKPTGVRCLELLGFAEYVGRQIPITIGGKQTTIQAEDFLDVCGQYATPAFIGLESMNPNDPAYAEALSVFRGMAAHYLPENISGSE